MGLSFEEYVNKKRRDEVKAASKASRSDALSFEDYAKQRTTPALPAPAQNNMAAPAAAGITGAVAGAIPQVQLPPPTQQSAPAKAQTNAQSYYNDTLRSSLQQQIEAKTKERDQYDPSSRQWRKANRQLGALYGQQAQAASQAAMPGSTPVLGSLLTPDSDVDVQRKKVSALYREASTLSDDHTPEGQKAYMEKLAEAEEANRVLHDMGGRYGLAEGAVTTAENLGAGVTGAVRGIGNALGYVGQLQARTAMMQADPYLRMWGQDAVADANAAEIQRARDNGLQSAAEMLESVGVSGAGKVDQLIQNFQQTAAEHAQASGKVTQAIANTANGVGGMVPSILSNIAVPGSGLWVMAGQAFGNATEEAIKAGATDEKAVLYGGAVAAVEVLTEKMFGGIPGLNVGSLDDAIENAVKKSVGTAAEQRAIMFFVDALGEGAEEFVSEFADWGLNKWLVGSDERSFRDVNKDAWYSALIGALTSVAMSTPVEVIKAMGPKGLAERVAQEVEFRVGKHEDAIASYQEAAEKYGLMSPEAVQAQQRARETGLQARQAEADLQRTLGADPEQVRQASQLLGRTQTADATYDLGGTGTETTNAGIMLPTARENYTLPTLASQQERGIMSAEEGTQNGTERRGSVLPAQRSERADAERASQQSEGVEKAPGGTEGQGRVSRTDETAFYGAQREAGETRRGVPAQTEQQVRIAADAKDKDVSGVAIARTEDAANISTRLKGSLNIVEDKGTKAMQRSRARAKRAGTDIAHVAGSDIETADGETARGALIAKPDGKFQILSRVDDADADADQITEHELGHKAVRAGKIKVRQTMDDFRANYHLGPEAANMIIDTYLQTNGVEPDANNQYLEIDEEELLCNALGMIDDFEGLDAFAPLSAGFREMRQFILDRLDPETRSWFDDDIDTETEAKTEPAKAPTNGEPKQALSRGPPAKPTVVDGAAVTPDVAKIMQSPEYQPPVDYMKLSVRTRDAWKKSYLEQFNSKDAERVARVVDMFTDKMIANDAIVGYVPVGSYKYDSKGPLRGNMEYIYTFDMDTSCPRTFQFLNYRDALQTTAGRPLEYNESINLLELMRAYGQQIPCAYCYVENKRALLSSSYNNFFAFRQNVMNAETDEEALKQMYSYDEKKGKVSGAAQKVFDKWRADRSYNPGVAEVWTASQNSRNAVLNYLDAQKKSGAITDKTSTKAVMDMVKSRFGMTDKAALTEAASFVADWMYDTDAEIEHTYTIPNTEDAAVDEKALALHHEALAYSKSASSAKSVENYAPYTDQLKNISKEDKDYINGMGGIRKHSSNDFRVDYVQDYIMFYADLAAGKWMGHTYTKNTDYVKIFGRTGDRINMSIAMYGDTMDTVRENLDEGMGWKDAKELRKAYKNAGVMAMVTNNAQLSYALNTEEFVDMIIPFHASGLDKAVWYNLRMWQDYTSKQLERWMNADDMKAALKEKGVEIPKGAKSADIQALYDEAFKIKKIYAEDGTLVKPHFLPGDTYVNGQLVPGHHNDMKLYKKLCAEYGVHPRFDGVMVTDKNGKTINVVDHPNYVRLVKETARTDSKQGPIQFNFDEEDPFLGMTPLDYAMQRMEEEAKNGGYENTKNDPYGIVKEFKEQYLGKNRPLGYLTDRAKQYQEIRAEQQREAQEKLDKELREDEVRLSQRTKKRPVVNTDHVTDMEYLAAAESGDEETAGRLVDEAAEKAMPDSKVRNKNTGKLRAVYHYTNTQFTEFRPMEKSAGSNRTLGDGYYVSTDPNEFKSFGRFQMVMFANITNPFEMEMTEAQAQAVYDKYFRPHHEDRFHTYEPHVLSKLQSYSQVFDYLKEAAEKNNTTTSAILSELGYDGVHSGIEWVAFDSSQLKSADPVTYDDSGKIIPLRDRFNPEKTDIRLSSSGRNQDITRLQSENKRLKKQVEYWQGQTKATEGWKADAKQEARVTRDILKSTSSKADADEMTRRITQLHEDLSNGKLTYEQGKETATQIASDIISKSERLVGKDVETYREARKILKSTPQTHVAYNQLQALMGKELFPDVLGDEARKEIIDDVMGAMKPFVDNPYDLQKAIVIESVADDIVNAGMEMRQAKPTAVDVERAKTAEAKAEGARALEEQRLVDRMFYERKIAEIRRQRDEKIEAVKQHQRDVNEHRREMREEANDRRRLLKLVKRLQGKTVDPVTKSQLPEILKTLDTVSVNITDKSIQNLTELRQWYHDKTTQGSDIYDPNFIPDKATLDKLDRLEKVMNGGSIGDMSIMQVRELTEVLLNIEHNMLEARKFQKSKLAIDNYEAGMRLIQDIDNAVPGGINRELSPLRAARRIAGYNDGAIEGTEASPVITLMQECIAGERAAQLYTREATHMLSKYLNDKAFMRGLYGRKAQEITITGYDAKTGEKRSVAITPAMRVSLYLHSLNDDNMRHVQEGGVLIPDMRLYKKGNLAEAYAADNRLKLTKQNVASICANMTEQERGFARALWRYFNEYAPKSLNETSVELDGYEKFNVENYFPISVDSNFLGQDYQQMVMESDGSLTHPGFGEERIQSSKPIYLRDVNDVFRTAVEQNAAYACKAVPLSNLNKLINVQQVGAVDSVSAALDRRFTAKKKSPVTVSGADYLAKFMRDYAGNRGGKKSGIDKMLAKIRSNYSGAVLTLAGGTAIKQAASYPTAAAVVSTKSLAQALNPARTVDVSFIDKYTATFTQRTEGYSSVEQAELSQEGRHIPKALNWIQAVDVATTKALKRAAAIEVQHTTNLKPGTREYEQAVVDMYQRIIEETQPNYSTALRPDILRSDSALERALVMFATQPMQNFGILYDAVNDFSAKRRAYMNTESASAKKAYQAAGKKLGKAIGSQLASSLVFALMQAAYDFFRKKDEKYRDEGEVTWESFAKGIGLNMLTNGAGLFIGGKVALEFMEVFADKISGQKIFGTQAYGFDVAELEAITDAVKSSVNAVGTVSSAVRSAAAGESVDYEGLARKVWTATEDALKLAGVPLENATTMITSVAKQVMAETMGPYIGDYYALRVGADPDSSKAVFYDNLYACWKKAPNSTTRELYDIMLQDGFTPDGVKSAMETRAKKDEGVGSVKELKTRWPLK